MGETMSSPSREDAHATDRRALQLIRWLTDSSMVAFPDTCGGKLGALH